MEVLQHIEQRFISGASFALQAIKSTGGKALDFFGHHHIEKNLNDPEFKGHVCSDKITIIIIIKKGNWKVLQHTTIELRSDQEVIMEGVKVSDGEAMEHASPELKKDKNFVLKAAAAGKMAIKHASETLRADAKFMLDAVKATGGHAMQFASKELKASKDFAKKAVGAAGMALQHAGEEFKKDKDLALAAVKSSAGKAMQFVHDGLRASKEFVMSAASHGEALLHADKSLKNDVDFCAEAVSKTDGHAISHLPKATIDLILIHKKSKIHGHKKIMIIIIEQGDGMEFQHASDELKNDKDVAAAAMAKSGGRAGKFLGAKLKASKEFMIGMAKHGAEAIRHAEQKLLSDTTFMLDAIKHTGGEAMQFASKELKASKDFAKGAVKASGMAIKHFGEELKKDAELALEAIKETEGMAARYVADVVRKDVEFIKKVGSTSKHLAIAMEETIAADIHWAIDLIQRPFRYVYRTAYNMAHRMHDDAEHAIAAIKRSGTKAMKSVSAELKKDRDFMIQAATHSADVIKHAPAHLLADADFAYHAALATGGKALQHVSDKLKKDRDFISGAIKAGGTQVMQYASAELRRDKAFVLDGIRHGVDVLEHAEKSLLADASFAFEAVKKGGAGAYKYLSKTLTKSKDFMLKLIKLDGMALEHADEALRKDKNFCKLAIESSGGKAMRHVHMSLKTDADFVLSVIAGQDVTVVVMVLHQADPALLEDHKFMIDAAGRTGGKAMDVASPNLKQSRSFALDCIKKDLRHIEFIDISFRSDKEFIVEAIEITKGVALEFASEALRNDREVVTAAIRVQGADGSAFRFAGLGLKKDYAFVIEFSRDHPEVLKYADQELLSNKRFVLEALKKAKGSTMDALKHANEKLKKDAAFMTEAIKTTNGRAMEFVHDELHKSRDFVLKAVDASGNALKHAKETFKKDRDIVLAAVKTTGGSIMKHAHDELARDKEFVARAVKHGGEAVFRAEHAAEEVVKDVAGKINDLKNMWEFEKARVVKKMCEHNTTVLEDVEMVVISFVNLCQKGTLIAIAACLFVIVFFFLFKYVFCPDAEKKSK